MTQWGVGGRGCDSVGGVGRHKDDHSPHKEERTEHTQLEDMPNGLNRIQSHHVLSLGSWIM